MGADGVDRFENRGQMSRCNASNRTVRICPIMMCAVLLIGAAAAYTGPTLSAVNENQTGQSVPLLDSSTGLLADEYVPHGPIVITSDADFVSQGWPGSGTPEAPFLIEHLNITADQVCISIHTTSDHFMIGDCFLKSLKGGAMCCVELVQVTNGVIASCSMDSGYSYSWAVGDVLFTRDGYGARVSYSEDCVLRNNTVYNNYYGVSVASSNSCTVLDSRISESWIGISLTDSVGCLLDWNYLSGNEYGALLTRADSSTVVNQTVNGVGGSAGIALAECRSCKIYDNIFSNSGLSVELAIPLDRPNYLEHWNHSVVGNTVNGKPLGYFWNCSNSTIDAAPYGQVILGGCRNVTVLGAVISNSSAAIQLGHCMNVTLVDCCVSNNSLRGVNLWWCEGCGVLNGTMTNNWIGIHLRNVKDVKIAGSVLLGNWRSLSAWYVNSSSFYNNSVRKAPEGIFLEYGSFCSIENNTIADCHIGIDLWFSEHCLIVSNRVFNSSQVGIRLTADSQYNSVYYNSIGWNARNAEDYGSSNTWDDGSSQGNKWTDYYGTGWYSVPGTAGSWDRFPSRLGDSTPSGQLAILLAVAIIASTVSALIYLRYKKRQ